MRRGIVGLLVVLGALAFAPAALADECPGQPPMEQPFAAWGDNGDYFLAPGGDFGPSNSWTLADGASVRGGLSPATENDSLVLPPGSSALSPTICVADGYRHARMMGAAVGSASTKVGVEVLYGTVDEATRGVRVSDSWDATRQFLLGQTDFLLDPVTGLGQIQLRFTSVGPGTAVLDDLFIDPTARH